jgi:glycosyltransferase involved in cell wall biosynthesis
MPVWNAGRWLAPALASLRAQSFRDFEIVAVDDGSTDGSGERLERAAGREPRLRVLHVAHAGVATALRVALAAARAPLIARQDADDLSHPRRLERQLDLLARRPDLGVVGSRVRLLPRGFAGVGMRRWVAWHNRLLDHESMAREVLIDSPLAHATAVARRHLLERVGGWLERGWPEDLDLWLRLLAAGARFAKLPCILYAWRQHAESATRRHPNTRRERFDALRLQALDAGPLRAAATVDLIGVGRSLERWRGLLEGTGRRVRARPLGRPAAAPVPEPPAVLVFAAAAARERWRAALAGRGWREGADFTFVA